MKIRFLLSNWYLNRAQKSPEYVQAHWWALGRLASRTQMYGSQHNLVPVAQVNQWLLKMLELDWKQESMIGFAAVMMSRKTSDRSIDISEDIREKVIEKLSASRATPT